jgi:serine/threonine protein kinase
MQLHMGHLSLHCPVVAEEGDNKSGQMTSKEDKDDACRVLHHHHDQATHREEALDAEGQTCLANAVVVYVLPYLDTITLALRAYGVARMWRDTVVECLSNHRLPADKEEADSHIKSNNKGRELHATRAFALKDSFTAHGARPVSPAVLARKFPWACFLAEGGFKKVYKVYNADMRRTEAVSVMDVDALTETGNQALADSEVRLSFLLSRLVMLGQCEHFIQVFHILHSSSPPPAEWGDADRKQPRGSLSSCLRRLEDEAAGSARSLAGAKPKPKRSAVARGGAAAGMAQGCKHVSTACSNKGFLYIRMELCDGGDVEEALRANPRPGERVVAALFEQMALSVLFAQRSIALRHYDIKLLNFFLKSQPCPVQDHRGGKGGAQGFWDGEGRRWVVKLADYGTGETDTSSIAAPLGSRHVTTWENVLPALLLYGDAARQGFASDMHALGLCLLHLCAGEEPYEETVEALRCPPALAATLRDVWTECRGRRAGQGKTGAARKRGARSEEGRRQKERGGSREYRYSAVAELLEGAEEDDVLLQDTLYRNLVLFAPCLVEASHRDRGHLQAAGGGCSTSKLREGGDVDEEEDGPVLAAVRLVVWGGAREHACCNREHVCCKRRVRCWLCLPRACSHARWRAVRAGWRAYGSPS